MKIEYYEVTIGEIVEGFENNDEEGVVGFGGRLDIRPKYQREFVYDERVQMAVIDSVFKGYPLNVMYWVKKDADHYEMLDGQQRTLSICQYYMGEFFINLNGTLKTFFNLNADEKKAFLDYRLTIYVCSEGTSSERIAWFKTINIAGKELTNQEILNTEYSGEWLTAAKRKFSKTQCLAWKVGKDYLSGKPIRQDYLETVLRWISRGKIEKYMAQHQNDPNADQEWQYFQDVIHWVKVRFPKVRREMKSVDWGSLYNDYHDKPFSATEQEEQVKRLMIDDDVTRKSGIYPYLVTGEERWLNIRSFSEQLRREAYERQEGICPDCHRHFELEEMEADHITPWSKGGHTTAENCKMRCKECNRRKSDK